MKLFFSRSEFYVTDTGLDNIPYDDFVCFNLSRLITVLSVVRGLINVPIIVTSGYRCPEVNAAVGGSKTSYHLYGRAADITCSKLPELLELCMKLKESEVFEEVIYYPDRNFIHVAI